MRREKSVTTWWSQQEREPPNWASACKYVLLISLFSAAAPERFFIAKYTQFRNCQARAIGYYVKAPLILQYSKRKGEIIYFVCKRNEV